VSEHINSQNERSTTIFYTNQLPETTMRLTLFSILAAILLVTATARRGTKADPAPPVARKNILVPQWGYPYGWGLGPEVGIEVLEDKEKETKQVKRGTSRKSLECSFLLSNFLLLTRSIDLHSGPVVNKRKHKDASAPVLEKKKFGWFRSTDHHYVDEVEEVLDGLE
jgi:hypothetical protein